MPAAELRAEIAAGVRFFGWFEGGMDEGGGGELRGLMGVQDVEDLTLIRHAYVLPEHQGKGIGGRLLDHLKGLPQLAAPSRAGASPRRPLLVGTWADAAWAVRFYERHGFRPVTPEEKDRLLRRSWRIPTRQVETSMVLRYVS
jgi:GNAT superfamily N-acetyltransferase